MQYELIDSGEGEKLERYGEVLMRRPDPGALWKKYLPEGEWKKAQAVYTRHGQKGTWKLSKEVPQEWELSFAELRFIIKPTSFKHTGLFPEQVENWQFTEDVIRRARGPVKVLNLFGYTGGATLAAARAGAEVCHVDGSKTAVAWARKNAALSGLADAPIRWIVDDCIAFLKRETKRGQKYDAIIMDPPAFGHGPKDELWKIEEDFLKVLDLCKSVLSENPVFIVINGYAAGYSPRAYEQSLRQMLSNKKGVYESGELVLTAQNKTHTLPCGIYARWSAHG